MSNQAIGLPITGTAWKIMKIDDLEDTARSRERAVPRPALLLLHGRGRIELHRRAGGPKEE